MAYDIYKDSYMQIDADISAKAIELEKKRILK